ncbi:MAG: hypothetical protein V1726_06720 [Methanobacteriota archaeon]
MMMVRGEQGTNYYRLLYPTISLVCIFIVVCSGCLSVTGAYVPDIVLTDGWYENTSLRNNVAQFLGLEHILSVTYEVPGDYPGSLTVMTLKSLVLLDEDELKEKTQETIAATLKEDIELNWTARLSGERYLQNGHKSLFSVYDGVDTSLTPSEEVSVIGEVWNCPVAGTSVICIGVAYRTHTTTSGVNRDTVSWEKIVTDPMGSIDHLVDTAGLIDNVLCH